MGNLSFVSAPVTDFVFERGKVYYLNINVSKEGTTTVEISSSVAWGNSETLPVPGTSTEVNPSPGQPGWENSGASTDMNGSSSTVNPSPGQPGWEVSEDESGNMTGSSTQIGPSFGNSGWTADSDSVELEGTEGTSSTSAN